MSGVDPSRAKVLSATGEELNRLMTESVHEALRSHRGAGRPVIVWRQGRIVELAPSEIEVPEPEPPS